MSETQSFKDIHIFTGGFMNRERINKILKLGTPVFIGMLVQNLVNITDNLMVGQMAAFVGEEWSQHAASGLAALGPATMFIWLVAGLFACINVGTQALVSRREGEERYSAAGFVLFNSSTIGFISGIIIAIIGSIYLVPWAFPFFHGNPTVQDLGIKYSTIRFYSIPAWVATFSIKAFWDGIGKTHVHMTAAVVMTLMNLVLNFILIFGVSSLGIEPMGIEGAAWGSTIGTYVGFLVVLGWLFKRKYSEKYKYFKEKKYNFTILKEIYRISIPTGVANIVIMSGFLFFTKVAGFLDDKQMLENLKPDIEIIIPKLNQDLMKTINIPQRMKDADRKSLSADIEKTRSSLEKLHKKLPLMIKKAKYSEDGFWAGLSRNLSNPERVEINHEIKNILNAANPALKTFLRKINYNYNGAATTVVISIAMIMFIGLLGFGQATATLVGQSLGRKDPATAQKYGFEAVALLSTLYLLVSLLTFLFPELLINMFTNDPLVQKAAIAPVKVWALAVLFVPAGLIFPQSLFAAGQSLFVMIVETTLHLLCLIPLSYVLAITFDMGIGGLWTAGALYIVILATIMGFRFGGTSWMNSKLKG